MEIGARKRHDDEGREIICNKVGALELAKQLGHWSTQTCIGALRRDALTAPRDHQRPMKMSDLYVATQLAPTLQAGDVVVLDILAAHKSAKGTPAAIFSQPAWRLVSFPASYSPEH